MTTSVPFRSHLMLVPPQQVAKSKPAAPFILDCTPYRTQIEHALDARPHVPLTDPERFLVEAEMFFHSLPAPLRRSVLELKNRMSRYPYLVLRGLPTDPEPAPHPAGLAPPARGLLPHRRVVLRRHLQGPGRALRHTPAERGRAHPAQLPGEAARDGSVRRELQGGADVPHRRLVPAADARLQRLHLPAPGSARARRSPRSPAWTTCWRSYPLACARCWPSRASWRTAWSTTTTR